MTAPRSATVWKTRAALAARPESLALHHRLAAVLHACHEGDEAVAFYRQAIRLKPDNAHAYAEIGKILATSHNALIPARGSPDGVGVFAQFRTAVSKKPAITATV